MNNYYEDASAALISAIDGSNMLSISSFNSPISNQAVIEASSVSHFGSDDCDRANMEVYLQFREYHLGDDTEIAGKDVDETVSEGVLQQSVRAMNIVILNPEADTKWTTNMINRVWRNRYPSSVAIDKDTGEVYLLFIESWGIELRHFAKLKQSDLQLILLTLNEISPYYLFITSSAMFDVLDGCEGSNHLLNNLYISFLCSKRITLKQRNADKKLIEDVSDD